MTPDSLLRNPDDSFRNISSCNGEFSYNRTKVGTVKLWIKYNNTAPIDRDDKPSNNSERTYPQWAYNFNTEERAKNNVIDTNNDSNYDADNFSITASPSDPDEDEEIDITIKARDGTTIDDGYRGTVRFKVQRWDNSNDTWITASTSLYNLSKTSYTFTSSDDGKHVFSNILTFLNDSYDYRFVAYDTNNNIDETYKIFDFGNGYDGNDDNNNDSNYDADNFYVTTDDTTPAVNQQVDLTVKARDGTTIDDGYRGTVDFEVRYRQIGTTTRTKTTSLSYYEMKYPYEANGYTFNSSNDGEITITDFIRLRKKGYEYKVLVVDNDNDIEGYKIFTVNETTNNNNNTSNYNTDNFSLTTDDATPTLNQQVDLTVQARDGTTKDTTYRGKIQFEVYKKASNATIWTLTTSANDFTMTSTYKSNGYRFTTSNA